MHKDTTVTVREQSPLSKGIYEVTVHGTSITVHTVTLSEDYYQQLTGGTVSPEVLIEGSFAFLLERVSRILLFFERLTLKISLDTSASMKHTLGKLRTHMRLPDCV